MHHGRGVLLGSVLGRLGEAKPVQRVAGDEHLATVDPPLCSVPAPPLTGASAPTPAAFFRRSVRRDAGCVEVALRVRHSKNSGMA